MATTIKNGIMPLFLVVLLALAFHRATAQVNSVSFKRIFSNYPKKVFEAQGSVLGGNQLVVMGGFYNFPGTTKDVYRRKVTNGKANWQKMASMPEPLTHMGQMVSGNLFCGAGGYYNRHPGKSVTSVLCFNMGQNKWTRLPNLPGKRAGGGLVLNKMNGKNELIFAGGVNRKKNSLCCHEDHSTTWKLDLNKKGKGWQNTGAAMPNPRNHMGAVQTCGRFFWVGGQYEEEEANGNQKTVSEYIPHLNKWKNVAPLPKPLGHISASVMAYKCGILVVAGTSQGYKRSKDVFWFNAGTNKWKKIGKYPIAAATPVCGLSGNKVMCATGGPKSVRNHVYIGTLN